MTAIEQVYQIASPVHAVWQALVDPKIIEKWGGGPAKMIGQTGEPFSLWGGDIFGKNIEVVQEKLLVQEWDDGTLPEPSIVRFELQETDGGTAIHFTQSNVPKDRINDLSDGWRDYYLGPLKALLEKQLP